MKVVSIINYKGGVGKTTLTANIGAEIANRGKRVLLIDLDPQTNLTFSFIKVDEWTKNFESNKTIKYWFDSILDNRSYKPSFDDLIYNINNFDIIFSHLGLIDVDIDLSSKLSLSLSGATERIYKSQFVETYSYLKNELYKLRYKYDVVLIDCPPNLGLVTKNAIIASDYFVIPAKMDYLSTLGINQLRNKVDETVQIYNTYCEYLNYEKANPQFLGVIATMVSYKNGDLVTTQKEFIDQLERRGITIFKNKIRHNDKLYGSLPQYGIPVVLINHNTGTYGDIKKELQNLTTEFMKKVGI